jgi:serine/threonine protein kinase/Tfp pilus assembly protein PilF
VSPPDDDLDAPDPPRAEKNTDPFAPGDLVAERYRIVRRVARGGMGLVYEAEDVELGGRVALKALRPEIALHTPNLARFRREIHLARRVTHPNICRLYDVGQHVDDQRAVRFLTMELLHGETLSRLVEREAPLSVERALPIVGQVVSGLAAAHQAGVVHRDFKPSNVLLVDTTRGQRGVVTDFGLSASIEEGQDPARLTATGQLMGTLAYLSPEQLEGKVCTPASDIYSFGCVFYLMMTGVLPFKAPTPLLTALKRLSDDPRPPREIVPSIPADFEAVILRCLERRPEDRYQSMFDVLAALGLDPTRDSTTSLPRPEILERLPAKAPAPRPEIPKLVALVGLALAGALGLSALWFWLAGKPREPRLPLTVEAAVPAFEPAPGAPPRSSPRGHAARELQLETRENLEAGLKWLGMAVLSSPGGSSASEELLASTLEQGPRSWRFTLERRDRQGPRRSLSFETPLYSGEEGRRLRLEAALAALYPESPRAAPLEQLELARLHAMVESPPAGSEFSWVRLHEQLVLLRQGLCGRGLPPCLDAMLLEARVARFLWSRTLEELYLESALDLAREAGHLYPEDPRPLLYQIEIALRSHRSAKAAAILERHDGWLQLDLSRVPSSCDAIADAVAQMRSLGGYGPGRHGHLAARLLIDAQCVPEAREALRLLLDHDPTHSWALEYLAELDLRGGDIARSAAAYEMLAGELAGPRLETVRINLGVARLYLHQYAEASKIFEELRRELPENRPVLLNSADALKLAGHAEEARERYLELANLLGEEPRSLDGRVMRAQALSQLGRYDEARRCLEPLLQQEGGNVKVLSAAALIEAQAGRREAARAYAKKVVERGVPKAWFELPFFPAGLLD